jgi:uncharacterized protein YdhG (YjbR/CyaY superfamily)
MEGSESKPATVDEYIAQYPAGVQEILRRIRTVVRESAPGATEKISYRMPGYHLKGYLLGFGAHKRHIGFYPTPSGVEEAFKNELAEYEGTKGSLHFPLDKPIPYDLIARIVKFRVAENQKKAASEKGPTETTAKSSGPSGGR